jgi:DNA-binding CsgD family transcriptional regulator
MEKINPLIPSIVHKTDIENICVPLASIGKIKFFVLYVIFNDGQKFVLSSTPEDFLSMYWHEKLYTHDYSTDFDLFSENSFYLCNEKLGIDKILKKTIESKFNMYRTAYISRECPECRFIFGALHDHQVIDPANFYKSTIKNFEDFCIDFIDQTINIIKFYNPNYNRSIILNDKFYRKSIIKMNYQAQNYLTEREVECLYWTAQGKTSEETASILKIKKSTVEDYRKHIKLKLNCSSMAHAVYEGVKRGYIGAFHKLDPHFFNARTKRD